MRKTRSLEDAAVDLALHEAAGRRAAARSLLLGIPAAGQAAVVRRAAALLAQAAGEGIRSRGDVLDTTEGGRLILKAPDGSRTALPPGTSATEFPELRSGSWLSGWNTLVDLAARAAAGETTTEGRLHAALRAVRERLEFSGREQDQAAVVAVQRLSSAAERARLQYEAVALYSLHVPGRESRDAVPGSGRFLISRALAAVEGEYSPEMRFLEGERRKSPSPENLYRGARTAELRANEEFDRAEAFAAAAATQLRPRFNELWRSGAPAKQVDDAFSAVRAQLDSVAAFRAAGEAAAREAGEAYATLAALYPGWRPAPDVVVTLRQATTRTAEQVKAQAMHDALVNLTLMHAGVLMMSAPAPAPRGPGTNVRVWGGATAADAAFLESAALRAAALQTARAEALAAGGAAARSASARGFLNQALDAFAARFAAIRQQAAAASRGVESEMRAAKALESKAAAVQASALRSAETEAAAAIRLAAENAESFAAAGAAERAVAGRAEAAATAARAAAQAERVAVDAIGVGRGGVPTVRGGTGETVVLPAGAISDPTQGPRLLRLVDVARLADTGAGTLADRLAAALRAARAQAGFTLEEQAKAAVLAVHGASDRAGRARLEVEAARMLGLFDPSRRSALTAAESEATLIGGAMRATETGAGAAGRAGAAALPTGAMQAAARETALLRMRAQGAAAAAGTAEQKVAAAMREMSRSGSLTPAEQFRAALEAAAKATDPAMSRRLNAARAALDAGRPVDSALLDLWRSSGGDAFKAQPLQTTPLTPAVVAPAPAPTGAGLPTAAEAARLFAPTREPARALTPWATLRTESETIPAARWQQVVQAEVRRYAGDPQRMVYEAMRRMVGQANLTAEEQFRAAVQAAYEIADDATKLRIRAEMSARNTGGTPGLSFPLLDLWRRAGGATLPTITVPGVPSVPVVPVVPVPAGATGLAPRYTPFGVLPGATPLSPFGTGLPSWMTVSSGLTGARPSPSARVSVGRAELLGMLDAILGRAA